MKPIKIMSVVVFTILSVIFLIMAFLKGCTKDVTYNGVVISHDITRDGYGHIHYHTIASFEDGNIRSIDGLKYYVIPIGGRIPYTSTVMK